MDHEMIIIIQWHGIVKMDIFFNNNNKNENKSKNKNEFKLNLRFMIWVTLNWYIWSSIYWIKKRI